MPSLAKEGGGYQHVVVTGTQFERGRMHGMQTADKIRTNIQRYRESASLPPSDICSRYIQDIYLPAIEMYFQEGLEEMRGIAEGAGVQLADIILLNARYDLSRVRTGSDAQTFVGECTSMAYIHESLTEGENRSSVYVAQNWDMSSWLHDLDTIIVLEIRNSEGDDIGTPATIITLTEAGQLARSGMTSAGVALCANSLWSNEDAITQPVSSTQTTFLPFTLARRMFLECGNIAAGLKILCSFPRNVSGNVIVASSSGIAVDLEISPSSHFTLYPKTMPVRSMSYSSLLTHANHYVSPVMQSSSDIHDTYPGGSSLFRDVRLKSILEKEAFVSKSKSHGGEIGIPAIRRAFADHAGYPRSLCEHADKGDQKYGKTTGDTMTVASVIYDLKNLQMHVCKGNPCGGSWKVYNIGKTKC